MTTRLTRRHFVAAALGTLAPMASTSSAQPRPPTSLRVGKPVLTQADFKLLGSFDIALGGEFSFGLGLAHRYVDGELRMLALTHMPEGSTRRYELREFRVPALGGTVSATTNAWKDVWAGKRGNAGGQHHGIYYDEASQRLLSGAAVDYPNDTQMMSPLALASTVLGPSGQVGPVSGLWGLEGIGARRLYGGFAPVPEWFQNHYRVGRWAVGFGGYSSRMAQGLAVSMGLSLIAIPDPSVLPDGGVFESSQFRVLADHTSGTLQGAWYPGGSNPSNADRGARGATVSTEYDTWKSPSPDGLGRWTWGDSAYQTGLWVDLPEKHGFVIVPTIHTGRTWYQNSTLNYQGRTAEIHVFDPSQFGDVALGRRKSWSVQPKSLWKPDEFPAGKAGQGNAAAVSGATFDTRTNRMYVRWNFHSGTWPNTRDRVFVYQVG